MNKLDEYINVLDGLPDKNGYYEVIAVNHDIGRSFRDRILFIVGDGFEPEFTYIEVRSWKPNVNEEDRHKEWV